MTSTAASAGAPPSLTTLALIDPRPGPVAVNLAVVGSAGGSPGAVGSGGLIVTGPVDVHSTDPSLTSAWVSSVKLTFAVPVSPTFIGVGGGGASLGAAACWLTRESYCSGVRATTNGGPALGWSPLCWSVLRCCSCCSCCAEC